ncbi:hypothetical protein NQZ68_008257 [Dissostichus eleginoides]|nr:hypothetical protein NQZ68_008257 [Dissostichus eleginoides]
MAGRRQGVKECAMLLGGAERRGRQQRGLYLLCMLHITADLSSREQTHSGPQTITHRMMILWDEEVTHIKECIVLCALASDQLWLAERNKLMIKESTDHHLLTAQYTVIWPRGVYSGHHVNTHTWPVHSLDPSRSTDRDTHTGWAGYHFCHIGPNHKEKKP